METNKLYCIAERDGITVDTAELPDNRSVSLKCGNALYVALHNGLETEAERRVCLAHELGHCETLSFYNIYSPLDVRGKHERRANCWAINQLVPQTRYIEALKNGYCDISSLAELFDVTEDFMRKAAEYYSPAVRRYG